MSIDFLGSVGDGGIAEEQPGGFEAPDVLETRDVELYFPVEVADRVIEVIAMAMAVPVQGREDIGEPKCDPIQ
jgi:hypothetical protein